MSEDIAAISSEDTEETIKLLKDVPGIVTSVTDVLRSVTNKLANGELPMLKGLNFLTLKNLCMLNYISNISYIVLRKLMGKKIENDPSIEHLIELRVVMEKMRPIEDKLKYQINKLLGTVTSQSVDIKDPLQFRANPDNLFVQDEEMEKSEPKESKVYIPPKIAATYYDEDNVLEHRKKALEQAQKKALSSNMLHELREEYDAGPEEIKEMHNPYKLKLNEELKRRERYEEEYMLRLPLTKKQRQEMRQLTTVTNFSTKFDDISALEMEPDNIQLKKKIRGKKGKFKGKGKKKGFKKR